MLRKTRNGAKTGGAASLPNPATVVSALLVALLVGASTLSGIALAAKPEGTGKPPKDDGGGDGGTGTGDIPVLVTFDDMFSGYYDSAGNYLDVKDEFPIPEGLLEGDFYWYGDKIGSDGFLLREANPDIPYRNDKKTAKTKAFLPSTYGNLDLDTKTSQKAGSGRRLFLDFSDFVDDDGDGVPDVGSFSPFENDQPAVDRAHLQTWWNWIDLDDHDKGTTNVDLRTMEAGEIGFAPMHIEFELEDPNAVPDPYKDDFTWLAAFGQSPGPFPCHREDHASWLKITCIEKNAKWTIESQDHPNNVVCLFSADTAFSTVTEHGHFHMPFRMTVEIDPEG